MTKYFDYAAATPVSPEVMQAMMLYFSEKFYNPSATYLAAQNTHKELENARARVAAMLGTRKNEIIFTAGGTEANNLAIRGVMEAFPGKKVLVSSIEHDAVIGPANMYDMQTLPVTEAGMVDVDTLIEHITDDTVLLSVMYANNEIGTIQPIRRIIQAVEAVRAARKQSGNTVPLYVHTDACQASNYLDLHVSRLGVDLMTINGGKIYGPKQSGALYVASQVTLAPQILGGGQERGKRSGTENIAFAVGLATALEEAQAIRHQESARMAGLQAHFFKKIKAAVPTTVINGSLKHRLPNNVHVTFPGADNERLIFALDEQGFQVAAGSACSASNDTPSHVLRALGLSDEQAQNSLRFTMGRDTTTADVDALVEALAQLLYTKA